MKRKVLSFLMSAALLFVLCACSKEGASPPEVLDSTPATPIVELSWKDHFDLGIRYLSEGKYEEAILAFEAALEIEPKNQDIYKYLADAYTKSNDIAKAFETLQRLLDAEGPQPDIGPCDVVSNFYTHELTPFKSWDSVSDPYRSIIINAISLFRENNAEGFVNLVKTDGMASITKKGRFFFRTETDGLRIELQVQDYDEHNGIGAYRDFSLEIREENGKGVHVAWSDFFDETLDPEARTFVIYMYADTVNWNYHGTAQVYNGSFPWEGDYRHDYLGISYMCKNLEHGFSVDQFFAPPKIELSYINMGKYESEPDDPGFHGLVKYFNSEKHYERELW